MKFNVLVTYVYDYVVYRYFQAKTLCCMQVFSGSNIMLYAGIFRLLCKIFMPVLKVFGCDGKHETVIQGYWDIQVSHIICHC